MGSVKYSKYIPQGWDQLNLEDLLNLISDYLLNSGFQNPFYDRYENFTDDQTLQDLYDAILEALLSTEQLPEELADQIDQMDGRAQDYPDKIKELLNDIVQRLIDEGYLTLSDPSPEPPRPDTSSQVGRLGTRKERIKFEITDKAMDFLGYRALKSLLGSLGKSSFGSHDTKDLATGPETNGVSKPYSFGDTLTLDGSATLLNALRRKGLGSPIEIDYQDLMVYQAEYTSSCATVLMLDCSHSMILYGEDRFTPAKRVALALSHLIRTQYPGDSIHAVLFHDSAEEIRLSQLAHVKVGPYYTNTCDGLRLARRILTRQKKDMRQIIMITDGKPSAISQGAGRIYKNAFGLDPLIISQTFKEVDKCRKAGILINTFMLSRDYDLVSFIKKVTEISKGKAYFTTPHSLGQYVLMDYMQKKIRNIH